MSLNEVRRRLSDNENSKKGGKMCRMGAIDGYFDLLASEICQKDHSIYDYSMLLRRLYDIPFEVRVEMDENRKMDALNMKMEYVESDLAPEHGTRVLVERFISVLEVLFALAKRMENDILCDPMTEIDNSSMYFWDMLRNLDVEKYKNDNFKGINVDEKVCKWLRRDYTHDGKGSIFYVPRSKIDMRKEEIWNQMQCYIMKNY